MANTHTDQARADLARGAELSARALLEPYMHIEQTQGKGMREKLIDAFNQWLAVDKDQLDVIKSIITQLHTASLL
jgi:geranylgeranyl diphosphate synthase type 3